MPIATSLRNALRPGLIASAQKICRNTRSSDDMPCSDCIYTVAVLHSDFLNVLPAPAGRMPRSLLCEEIMGAAQDA